MGDVADQSFSCLLYFLSATAVSNANRKDCFVQNHEQRVRQVKSMYSVALKAEDEILVYAMNRAQLRPSDCETSADPA